MDPYKGIRWAGRSRIVLRFADHIPVRVLGSVLVAIDLFDSRAFGMMNLVRRLRREEIDERMYLGLGVRAEMLTPSMFLNGVDSYLRARNAGAQILYARFDSPGIITLDGSGALEKLIDVLHAGDLEREERKAIVERILAETRLIDAQAFEKRVQALANAVGILTNLGVAPIEILELLTKDKDLGELLGLPINDVRSALDAKLLKGIERD